MMKREEHTKLLDAARERPRSRGMMKREEQTKLLESGHERLRDRVTNWLKVPAVKAAVHRKDDKADGKRPTPQRPRRASACV